MRTLLIATTALAVGFALPAVAANGSNDQQQGYTQSQGNAESGHQGPNDRGFANQAMGNQGSGYQGQGFQGQNSQAEQRYPGGNNSSGWSGRPSENQGMNNRFNSGSWSSQAENNQGGNHRADQLRQRIRNDLAQGGFTDIHIIPRSFVVIAKDPEGNQVQMMITPNSVAEMTQVPMSGRMARRGDQGEFRSGGNSTWNYSTGSSGGNSSGMQGGSGSSTDVTR